MAVSVLRFFCFEMLHVLHIPRFLRNIQQLPVKKGHLLTESKVLKDVGPFYLMTLWDHSLQHEFSTFHRQPTSILKQNPSNQRHLSPQKMGESNVQNPSARKPTHWRNQHFQFGSLWLDWPRRFTGNRVTLLLLKTIGWSYLLSIFQKSLEHQRLDDAKTL